MTRASFPPALWLFNKKVSKISGYSNCVLYLTPAHYNNIYLKFFFFFSFVEMRENPREITMLWLPLFKKKKKLGWCHRNEKKHTHFYHAHNTIGQNCQWGKEQWSVVCTVRCLMISNIAFICLIFIFAYSFEAFNLTL